jgi:hypothetical protein
MADNLKTVLAIVKMRGYRWVTLCLKTAYSKANGTALSSTMVSQAQMGRISDEVPDKDLWSKYKIGFTPPSPSTVIAVEKSFPGTAEIWLKGPWGLPLWDVLAGGKHDQLLHGVLDAVLLDELDLPSWSLRERMPFTTMALLDKVQALIEISIPDKYWSREMWKRPANRSPDYSVERWESLPTDVLRRSLKSGFVATESFPTCDDEPSAASKSEFEKSSGWGWRDHVKNDSEGLPEADYPDHAAIETTSFKRDDYFLTLSELVEKKANVLMYAYSEGKKLHSLGKSNDGRFAFKMLEPRRLLAFIAALVLLRCNGSYEHIFKYISDGLRDAITDKFGKDVYAYIATDKNKFDGALLFIDVMKMSEENYK